MTKKNNKAGEIDPRALIFESYQIEGITEPECRAIFFDWAMGAAEKIDTKEGVEALLQVYQADFPNHPMTKVLKEGAMQTKPAKRRGGWRSRRS